MTEPSHFEPRLSERHPDWQHVLFNERYDLLPELVKNDRPGAALLELQSYINGLYYGSRSAAALPRHIIEAKVARMLPFIEEIRSRVGWSIRQFDMKLLRLIRGSGVLSVV